MHTEIGDFHYFDDDNTNIAGGTATGNAVENAAGAVTSPNVSSLEVQSAYTSSPVYGISASNNYQIQSPSDFASPTTQNTFGSLQQSPSFGQTQVPNYTSSTTNGWQINSAKATTPNPQNQANQGQDVAWFGEPPAAIRQAIGRYVPDVLTQYPTPNFASENHSGSNRQETNGAPKDFSEYTTSSLNMGLTAQPGQAHLRDLDTSLIQNRKIIDSPYSNNILENDCYQSQRFEPFARQVRWNEGENQGVIYATPEKHGTDQPTKYGISQGALDLYRSKFNDIANTYPIKVKDLTEEQAMNLLCQYYKGSRAEAINDPNLAFAVYDSYFNSPNNASVAWQQTLKTAVNPDISIGDGIGSQTLNSFNSVKSDTELLDTFIENRKNTLDKKYKNGLINRFRRYSIK